MGELTECPNCGKKIDTEKTYIRTCGGCRVKYCCNCQRLGKRCPACGSSDVVQDDLWAKKQIIVKV